jgi:ATP-dependent RNA helicase DDX19/DBP5
MSSDDVLHLNNDGVDSVYSSDHTWDDLQLKSALLTNIQNINWVCPTKIQGLTIQLITQGRNIAAQSKNGTGKTGAFVIGALNKVDKDFGALQAICISHTRELNQQNFSVFSRLAENTGILIGITNKGDREVPKCHILCGTHGTLANLFKLNPAAVRDLRVLVYDECDVLLTHEGNLEVISRLRAMAPAAQQVLFSATFTDKVWEFIQANIPNPTTIRIEKNEDLTLDNVDQYLFECQPEHRQTIIFEIIRKVSLKTCLVFLNTKRELDELHEFLTERGYKTHVIAAAKVNDEVRDQIIEKVRRGEVKVLLTTNLLSRGVDLRHINIVINADPPVGEHRAVDCHTYLHRVGRTGRFGRRGVVVNIVDTEQSREHYRQIEAFFNREFLRSSIEEIAERLEKVNEDYAI